MSTVSVRAVLADDERLLREQLKTRLSEVWPDLVIVGEARDGREAVELVAQTRQWHGGGVHRYIPRKLRTTARGRRASQ